jgi:hypothetical protein
LINGKFNDPTYECPTDAKGNKRLPTDLIKEFNNANKNSHGFNANISYKGLYAELDNYMSLSGTTAYAKLLKLAGRK